MTYKLHFYKAMHKHDILKYFRFDLAFHRRHCFLSFVCFSLFHFNKAPSTEFYLRCYVNATIRLLFFLWHLIEFRFRFLIIILRAIFGTVQAKFRSTIDVCLYETRKINRLYYTIPKQIVNKISLFISIFIIYISRFK